MTPLITGANRGIGLQVLQDYAARGDSPIGTARRQPPAVDGARWETLDVTDPASIRALADQLKGTALDLLVCNAALYLDKGQPLDDGYPPEMWAQMFATNVTGVFLTIQALLPNLRRAPSPKIAILSSMMASDERAPGKSYIYRASKAAVLNLGRNLSSDLAPEGIAVGIYHPGWVRTDMGGTAADLGVEQAAAGLIARFDALDMGNTGCFETWDGQPHPY
ncbi:SDR family oxidoreductase [Rhodovulum adriaticum]|uniref:NAD(P)-dependent dehydrogenase (Short-subunit alcohol dehydrogenase family) n=1 Tax=Rhodovulum adriaticum TaxID=35804 RepID=A0A4R2NNK4_RHOAD|nr:SDR family oxidoreductase [Rhodovulum adriaticum]MBK1636375.1 short-chain dehydrogenase [Rhodovulum adriaticum]TCP22864.1 NAD(P)-dependent dehydrogenase (short-subunit alcohol dehydrogenase family) [Rhodovulum adriaticum]